MQNKIINTFLDEVLSLEIGLNSYNAKNEEQIFISLSSNDLEELEGFMSDFETYNYDNEISSTEGHTFLGVLNRTKILEAHDGFYVLFTSRNNINKLIEGSNTLKHLEEYIKRCNLNIKLGLLIATPHKIKCYGDIDKCLSPYMISIKLNDSVFYKFYNDRLSISYDLVKLSIKLDDNKFYSDILDECKVFYIKSEGSQVNYDELKISSFSI